MNGYLKIVILLGCVSQSVHAGDLPPVVKVGQGACLSGQLIYRLDDKPTPQCHASTIAQASDGGLVAAWFGGTHEKHEDVGIWTSRFTDGRWSKPQNVATGAENEDKLYPCWNPVLFQPKIGPLLLFYKVGPSPKKWWGVMMDSSDGGKSWKNRHKLGEPHPVTGPLVGPIKNKSVQLADGAILCPSSSEHKGWRVHFELTRDLGKTWQVIGPINDGKTYGAIQPSVLLHANGRLQVMCRSRQNVVTQSWSDDGGKNWSKMVASNLPNPNSGTDAVTLRDGRHLIVYNHTTRKMGKRAKLHVALSKDGKTWHPALTLEDAERGEFSYPAVIQAADGKIHITYTFNRRSVKHVVLDPTQL